MFKAETLNYTHRSRPISSHLGCRHHSDRELYTYQQFLRKVFKNAGPQIVVLCAVGLGRTAVKAMKDRVRVDLPFELKDQATSLESAIIQSIVDKHMQIGATNNTRYQCG